MFIRRLAAIAIFIALAMFLWLSGPAQKFLHPQKAYNVIFIDIDTLRADHMGTYGYLRDTSPNLDAFAKEAVVFEQAIAQAPWTLPSAASILVSQYPSAHGLVDRERCISSLLYQNGWAEQKGCLSPSALTLPEVLGEQGYKTAAFVGGGDLKARFGFSQGFDVYEENIHPVEKRFFDTTIPQAEEWLRQNKGNKLFLYLEGYDVHAPYDEKPEPYNDMFDKDYQGLFADHTKYEMDDDIRKPKAILNSIQKIDGKPYLVQNDGTKILLSQRDIDNIVAHYDGGIRYTDDLIQGFFNQLKQMGLYDNSIIIVSSNHGEGLADNMARIEQPTDKLVGHFEVYDETSRIPLIIKVPGLAPSRVSSQVQLIDVFPTILDFLNIPQNAQVKANIQGQSLIPVIEGKTQEQFAYGELGKVRELSFVRTLQWKLIRKGVNEYFLYNLQDDPKETKNLIDSYADVANSLKKNLFEWTLENLKRQAQ